MGVFGSSGTRGVVGEELTPAFVGRLAAVAATHWDVPRVAIGRDTRLTGRMLANAASSGVASAGVDVERVGVVPTPALQDYLADAGMPGIMITASHNPPEYNGMKLFDDAGVELSGAALEDVEAAYAADDMDRVAWNETGSEVRVEGVRDGYVEGILDVLDRDAIRAADLTVAVDPGHGAGARTTPRLCRELGCQVFGVNDTQDGTFPGRRPEPVPEALADLSRLVRAGEADMGVAHDGDADRAMFVDETGEVISGDTALAVLAAAVIEPGDTMITAVNASERVSQAVEAAGGSLERTPIGSAQLVERIRSCQERGDRVPVAGEGNGGVFFPEHSLARDGAYALGRMLELVAERPLEERADEHGGYHLIRHEVAYDSRTARDRMLLAVDEYGKNAEAEIDRTDGIRLDFGDGWALARESGTEPLIRIVAEASDAATAEAYAREITELIEAA